MTARSETGRILAWVAAEHGLSAVDLADLTIAQIIDLASEAIGETFDQPADDLRDRADWVAEKAEEWAWRCCV